MGAVGRAESRLEKRKPLLEVTSSFEGPGDVSYSSREVLSAHRTVRVCDMILAGIRVCTWLLPVI